MPWPPEATYYAHLCIQGNEAVAIMAHFAAHNEPLASMTWSPDGRLLLTTDTSACVFHIFSILTHPYTPLLSAVQHLYRLRRGTTIAKVSLLHLLTLPGGFPFVDK